VSLATGLMIHPSKLIMTNNKAKLTPPHRLQRITNEVLFIKRFHHSSDLSPADMREQLEALAYQPKKLTRVFFPRQRIVTIEALDETHDTFEIKTKLGGLYTELRAKGHIYCDDTTNKTTLTGAVKFDAVYLTVLLAGLFFLITWAMVSVSRIGNLPSPFILFTLGLTNLYYFRQMFLDRNDLLKTLTDTLATSDLSSARERLAMDAASEEDYNDTDDLHQQYSITSNRT
jgi:hypothetical protein